MCSIYTPPYRNPHGRNQRQCREASSRRLNFGIGSETADLPGATSTIRRDENHLVRDPGSRDDVPLNSFGNAVRNHKYLRPYAFGHCRATTGPEQPQSFRRKNLTILLPPITDHISINASSPN
ncbi:hypothetical protein AVEN_256012-1 [Araneus ventricosus]|uniref:Uncharacterized protein n=1 Tax=Araneus ventricosus TaxID=182803 RepID=A0A4Y2RZW1_ARAVE|nr:hypothetical protein AVEN_256012-1 [Araneus ventricosus]